MKGDPWTIGVRYSSDSRTRPSEIAAHSGNPTNSRSSVFGQSHRVLFANGMKGLTQVLTTGILGRPTNARRMAAEVGRWEARKVRARAWSARVRPFSPSDERCNYPATVHCARCGRWFCDSYAEEEEWHPRTLAPGDEGGEA